MYNNTKTKDYPFKNFCYFKHIFGALLVPVTGLQSVNQIAPVVRGHDFCPETYQPEKKLEKSEAVNTPGFSEELLS